MTTKHRLGVRVRTIRKQKGITQDQLAARMGRSVDALSNIERGKSLPSFQTIEQLCEALEIELKTLFDFTDLPLPARNVQLLEELYSIARELPHADLELAVEQIKAISRRSH